MKLYQIKHSQGKSCESSAFRVIITRLHWWWWLRSAWMRRSWSHKEWYIPEVRLDRSRNPAGIGRPWVRKCYLTNLRKWPLDLNLKIHKIPTIEMTKLNCKANFLPFISDNKFTRIRPIKDPIGKIDWIITLAFYFSQYRSISLVSVNSSSI